MLRSMKRASRRMAAGGGSNGAMGTTTNSTAFSTRSAGRRWSASARWRRERECFRQARGLQPDGLGQGPAGARRHRGGGALRRPEAGPDGDRGHQRQYRHRARHGVRPKGLSAGRGHGGEFLRRAAQAHALSRRPRGADAGGGQGQRHARQGPGTGGQAWLVPGPAVRERGQCRGAFAHHGAGDPGGLRGRAAGLLGDRLRHRRHAQGRGAGAAGRAARDPHHRVRAGQFAGARQRHRPARGRQPSGFPPASDAGLGARFHRQADPGRACRRPHRQDSAGERGRRLAPVAGPGDEGGDSRRHLRRRDARRRACRSPRPRRRAATSCACSPTPASAI
jgi:hypothetical protein